MRTALYIAAFLFFPLAILLTNFAQKPNFESEQKEFLVISSAGKQLTEIVLVKNLTDNPVKLESSWQGYQLPEDEVVSSEITSKHSIDFASISGTHWEIPARGIQIISVSFNNPANLRGGDYYGSLVLTDGQTTSPVKFTLRIPGTREEKINLEKIERKNSKLVFTIANSGNYTTNVSTTTKVNTLMRPIEEIKSPNFEIKAGQIYRHEVSTKALLPAFYQTETTLIYGEAETQSTGLLSFWVWPHFFTALIVVLITILVITWKKRKAHV